MSRIKDTRRSFDEGGEKKKKKKTTLGPNVLPLWYELVKQAETEEAKSSLDAFIIFDPPLFTLMGCLPLWECWKLRRWGWRLLWSCTGRDTTQLGIRQTRAYVYQSLHSPFLISARSLSAAFWNSSISYHRFCLLLFTGFFNLVFLDFYFLFFWQEMNKRLNCFLSDLP